MRRVLTLQEVGAHLFKDIMGMSNTQILNV